MTYATNGPYLMAQSVPDTDLVAVVFHWTAAYGPCRPCGLPAAYDVDGQYKACSVCAAQAAADGELIRRLSDDA
jgi:hypothetical protein